MGILFICESSPPQACGSVCSMSRIRTDPTGVEMRIAARYETDVLLFFHSQYFGTSRRRVYRGRFGGILAVDLFGIFPIPRPPVPFDTVMTRLFASVIGSMGEFNRILRVSV